MSLGIGSIECRMKGARASKTYRGTTYKPPSYIRMECRLFHPFRTLQPGAGLQIKAHLESVLRSAPTGYIRNLEPHANKHGHQRVVVCSRTLPPYRKDRQRILFSRIVEVIYFELIASRVMSRVQTANRTSIDISTDKYSEN
jgi:hypothetical protein